jgi:hypothetical protein
MGAAVSSKIVLTWITLTYKTAAMGINPGAKPMAGDKHEYGYEAFVASGTVGMWCVDGHGQ